jgi:hypothetical protein
MSAQPGSATGTTTPFATVNVSPFLWYVYHSYARVWGHGGHEDENDVTCHCVMCATTRGCDEGDASGRGKDDDDVIVIIIIIALSPQTSRRR